MPYRPDTTLPKAERLKRFYKDLFYEGPKEMLEALPHIGPKHHITVHKLKSGKVIIHIPKSWKDEWKMWSGPMKLNWTSRGIEPKFLKKDLMSRREVLEKAGMLAGLTASIVAMPASPLARTGGPGLLMWPAAIAGEKVGDKIDDYLERHKGGFAHLKRKERQFVKKFETGLKKVSPVEVR